MSEAVQIPLPRVKTTRDARTRANIALRRCQRSFDMGMGRDGNPRTNGGKRLGWPCSHEGQRAAEDNVPTED